MTYRCTTPIGDFDITTTEDEVMISASANGEVDITFNMDPVVFAKSIASGRKIVRN